MSMKGSLTKELNESVNNLLGPNVKISLKCLVKMEIKSEKTENKILAFSACRLFILSAKIPTKIEQTFHYLDINSIESKRQNQLILGICENKSFTFYSVDPNNGEEINLMIIQLGTAIKTIFPQIPLENVVKKIDVEPANRLKPMLEYNESVESRARDNTLELPCGAFSTQYACMCDYFGYPFREEVSWDVDSIYFTHNITELSLLDFEHLDTKDLIPIISALSYNGWFNKFRASNVKVFSASSHSVNDVSNEILNLMKRSTVLEELYLENTGIKTEFVNKIFMALLTNSHSPLHTIDLSNNLIEDKSLKSLCGFVAKVTKNDTSPLGHPTKLNNKGLMSLNLAHTGITAKGVSELADALTLNKSVPSTLTYLNLSGNILKDDVNKLYNFLAQPNCLSHIDLSATECCLDTIFGALLRGCTQKLTHLNLSRNQFTSKKSHKDVNVPPSFKAFFSSTVSLKTLNLSYNKLPADALKAMLLGFACNEIATDVRLNLSSNELKSNGATVLELCIVGIRCISGLDLSDNGFDADIANAITAIGKNKYIKYLSIGKNFYNIKPKHLTKVLDSLVHVLQDDDSALESLSICDSKLKNDTSLIINALGNNQSLLSIDVSGNLMGLSGAKTLAKALQVNSKLETIYMDRNLVPTFGFIDIAYSLERNFTLKHMPVPVQDVQTAMVKMAEKTETAICKIQELLRRNNLPHNLLRNSRLHTHHLPIDPGIYHMVDKLIAHLQDIISNHLACNNNQDKGSDDKSDEIVKAENFLRDATNAKHLLTRLNQQYIFPDANLESGRRFSSVIICKPIETNLLAFSNELKNTTEAYINNTVTGMLQYVQEVCPNIFENNDKLEYEFQRILSSLPTLPLFPSMTFFHNSLTDNVGTQLAAKIEEFLQAIAVQICDKILVEMCECLTTSYRSLTGQEQKSALNYQRSSTPDVLRNRIWNSGTYSRESSTEANLSSEAGQSEYLDAATATPKQSNQKRQSLYARRLRPQSVLDGLSNDDTPDLLPKADSFLSPYLNDTRLLASSSNEALEHLGKSRPKKPKTRAPTRVTVTSNKQNAMIEKKCQESSTSAEKLDDGLDNFFKKTAVDVLQKPMVQPRGLFKKNNRVTNERNGPNSSSKSSIEDSSAADESMNNGTSREEVTRSRSSPNLGNKRQSMTTSSLSQRNNSPCTEEISSILERVERISSPVPPEHAELLAEMRVKQGKRSLAPTPTQGTISEESSAPETTVSSSFQGIKLRASVFGDVMKSPSKVFSSNPITEEMSQNTNTQNESGRSSLPRQSVPPPLKQRPKSVVGILGSKFELSSGGKSESVDFENSDGSSSADNSKSDKNEERSHSRKSIAIYPKPRSSHSSSLPK